MDKPTCIWNTSWISKVRDVTKISNCRVNTTSRQGIKQQGISFLLVLCFFYFPMKVAVGDIHITARGNPRPVPINDSPERFRTS